MIKFRFHFILPLLTTLGLLLASCSPFAEISSADVINQNPDFILLGDSAFGVTVASVMQRPGWSAINAVKNNRVFTFDNNLGSQPTARIVDAVENLTRIIHPEVFK